MGIVCGIITTRMLINFHGGNNCISSAGVIADLPDKSCDKFYMNSGERPAINHIREDLVS